MYPELVVRDTDGKLQSVRYLEFTALLLNELQVQAREIKKLRQQNDKLGQQNTTLWAQLAQAHAQGAAFNQRLATLEQMVQSRNAGPRLAAAGALAR